MECTSKSKISWWFVAGSLIAVLCTYLINEKTPYHFLAGLIGGAVLALSGQLFLLSPAGRSVMGIVAKTVAAALASGALFFFIFRMGA